MKSHRLAGLVAAVSALALFAGCASNTPRFNQPAPYPSSPYPASQGPNGVQYGHVQSVELIRGENQTSGAGAVLGGVIGAVVGRQIGSGTGRNAATAVGVVSGAVIGNQIEKNQRGARDFYRVVVRLDDGSQRQFDFEQAVDVREGERIYVQNNQLMR
jgi:outer membrane lipoprotein SlyB